MNVGIIDNVCVVEYLKKKLNLKHQKKPKHFLKRQQLTFSFLIWIKCEIKAYTFASPKKAANLPPFSSEGIQMKMCLEVEA